MIAAGAEFLLVGAHALAVHGTPRATGDLDVWVRPSIGNAERVFQALIEFGAPLEALNISQGDLSTPDTVIQIGQPPRRIDLLTSLSGLSFEEALEDRVLHLLDGLEVAVLGRRSLIRNKRASGRPKDLADLAALSEGDQGD